MWKVTTLSEAIRADDREKGERKKEKFP